MMHTNGTIHPRSSLLHTWYIHPFRTRYRFCVLDCNAAIVSLDDTHVGGSLRRDLALLNQNQELDDLVDATTAEYTRRVEEEERSKQERIRLLKRRIKDAEEGFIEQVRFQRNTSFIRLEYVANIYS